MWRMNLDDRPGATIRELRRLLAKRLGLEPETPTLLERLVAWWRRRKG